MKKIDKSWDSIMNFCVLGIRSFKSFWLVIFTLLQRIRILFRKMIHFLYASLIKKIKKKSKKVFYHRFYQSNIYELLTKSEVKMYGLLTKCEVKMAGYWPSSFFCVFMDRDEVEVNKLAKKERGQYSAILTKQTWSIKDLLYGFW